MDLSRLSPSKGSRKASKRLGRGEGSGLGKTSGKGHKGQKARAGGKVREGFEGGQMPLYRRVPKFGFRSRKEILGLNQYNIVGLDVLERFETGSVVDSAALRLIGYGDKARLKAGIKILANGSLTKKLTVRVEAVTASARAAIEAAGGTVESPVGVVE
jgi:large subunit ribosomal protein L15